MSVLERDFLIRFLPTLDIDIDTQEILIDKILEYQRLVHLRLSKSRSPLLRNAAIVELACRQCNIELEREKLISKLGLIAKLVDYRRELSVCEASLGIKRDSAVVARKLSLQIGIDAFHLVETASSLILQKYVASLAPQQRPIADLSSPVLVAASYFLGAQEQKIKLTVRDIARLADCSQSDLNTMLHKLSTCQTTFIEDFGGNRDLFSTSPTVLPSQTRSRPSMKRSLSQLEACLNLQQSNHSTEEIKIIDKSFVFDEPIVSSDQKRAAYEAWKRKKLEESGK